jgi:O-antigen/teichoic acid export membrane protein
VPGLPSDPDAPDRALPVRGGVQIAVAMAVMNVATYGFTILAARLLGPEEYGGVAAVMNLLLVVSVVALALQATAARRISAEQAHVAQIERGVLRVGWHAALVTGGALLVLSPVVAHLLRLDSLVTAVLVGLTAVPVTAMGAQAGVLQGERRWGALGAVYVASGVPRLVVGAGLLWWRPSELVAVAAVALGSVAPVVVGWWVLRSDRRPGAEADHHRGRAILVESLINSQALLAFFALANLDVVVARNVLTPHGSGLYAGGLILTKALLFLPQFVVVVAFPSLATVHERVRALVGSLAAIAAVGGLGTIACWLLPEVALLFVGGEAYADIADELWLFALLGTVLAALQLLVYATLARQGRRTSLLLWAGLVAMLVAGATADSVTGLVLRVIAVDTVLLAVLIGLSAWLVGHDRRLRAAAEGLTHRR